LFAIRIRHVEARARSCLTVAFGHDRDQPLRIQRVRVENQSLTPKIELERHRLKRSELLGGYRVRANPAAFLRSFFAGEPDWSHLGLPIDPSRLPAVQWKLQNLGRLRAERREKFDDQLARLDEVLVGREGER